MLKETTTKKGLLLHRKVIPYFLEYHGSQCRIISVFLHQRFFLLATCDSIHTVAFFIFMLCFVPPLPFSLLVCLFECDDSWYTMASFLISFSLCQSHFLVRCWSFKNQFQISLLTTHVLFFAHWCLESGWFSCNIPEENQRHGSGFLISWMKFVLKISFSPVPSSPCVCTTSASTPEGST